MGTRSTTKFIKKKGDKLIPLVNIYQQYDGYVEGKGYDLANYLNSKKIINGIKLDQNTEEYANGFECLVAQYIRDFKEDVGHFYIDELDDKQEYNYEVIFDEDKYYGDDPFANVEYSADDLITIKVDSCPNFEGTPSELLNFKENFDDEE